jgi:surface protein
MIFRLATSSAIDSALASAAVAAVATAVVLVATKATAVTATGSKVAERTTNGHFVPRKIIADGPSALAFDGFQDVSKEGIELSLQNENQRKETDAASTGTDRRLRNKSFVSPMEKVGDNGNDHNTIDLGVLDPINRKDVRNLESLVDTDQDGPTITCDVLCGSDRKEITDDSDIESLVSYCEDNDCNCYGDGDYIDYRCPSQFNCWDTSKITNMRSAFYKSDFNEPLRCWDVSKVTDMAVMFDSAIAFNQDISDWDVSSVKDMTRMFRLGFGIDCRLGEAKFDQDIGKWDVSSVTNMDSMFYKQAYFNHPLQSWDVSSVKNMNQMFYRARDFNQPIDAWDVSSVTNVVYIFGGATSFNQPVDVWDISSVTTMRFMFFETSFNQCLSTWAAKNILSDQAKTTEMFYEANCPDGEYSPNINIGPWCQGSSDTCFEETCVDDPNFRFDVEGEEPKNCEWVASGDLSEKRCAKEGVSEACSKTCNPTCRGIICVDDPDFRLGGVKAKNCEWVAKQKTEERCKKPGVLDACPVTCDQSCAIAEGDCTDDPGFRLNGIKGKGCEWVAKQKTDKRCEKLGVMDSCRRTCNPSCGCRDTTDEFEFQGSTITCDDLDITKCDEAVTSSDDFSKEQLAQLDVLFQTLVNEALTPIQQRLDVIEDAVVEEEEVAEEVIEEPVSGKTYGDLCPNKCKKCIDSYVVSVESPLSF